MGGVGGGETTGGFRTLRRLIIMRIENFSRFSFFADHLATFRSLLSGTATKTNGDIFRFFRHPNFVAAAITSVLHPLSSTDDVVVVVVETTERFPQPP